LRVTKRVCASPFDGIHGARAPHRTIDSTPLDLAAEVGMSWGVDDVDAVPRTRWRSFREKW